MGHHGYLAFFTVISGLSWGLGYLVTSFNN